MPMFPLGSVLVPGLLLPLHVFEPRYRALVHDVLAADGRFGVTLIERGSEVGGGDERTAVGTAAQIVQAEESPDGRWGILAVGEERIRVLRWLDDDPYPRAVAEPLVDEFVLALRAAGATVATGRFGADMQVRFTNDGPITVLFEV